MGNGEMYVCVRARLGIVCLKYLLKFHGKCYAIDDSTKFMSPIHTLTHALPNRQEAWVKCGRCQVIGSCFSALDPCHSQPRQETETIRAFVRLWGLRFRCSSSFFFFFFFLLSFWVKNSIHMSADFLKSSKIHTDISRFSLSLSLAHSLSTSRSVAPTRI